MGLRIIININNMTHKEITKIQKELEKKYAELDEEISCKAMRMVNEIVELELQLEAECGQ